MTPLKFVDLALGEYHACGLTAAGLAYCWGRNDRGQLGDSAGARDAPVTPAAGGRVFAEIEAGDNDVCGRTSQGEVWCWGWDSFRAHQWEGSAKLPLPAARGLAHGMIYTAVSLVGGSIQFLESGGLYAPSTAIQSLGIAQIEGRASYCTLTRDGSVYCSGSVIDGGSCSSIPPAGCAPAGPVPLPTGGKSIEWWDR